MSVYEQKYLKYKNKYNILKQTGGAGKLVAYFINKEGVDKVRTIISSKSINMSESDLDKLLAMNAYKIEFSEKKAELVGVERNWKREVTNNPKSLALSIDVFKSGKSFYRNLDDIKEVAKKIDEVQQKSVGTYMNPTHVMVISFKTIGTNEFKEVINISEKVQRSAALTNPTPRGITSY